jgi:sterol desaturase/sphingolipid hydroxylase (fatty acid hydroxylase superfamily)
VSHFLEAFAQAWTSEVAASLRQYLTYAVGVWLVLWVILSIPLKARKIREDSPPPRQLARELVFSLRTITLFATIDVAITLLDQAGFYPLPKIGAQWGPVWFWTSLVLIIVAHDAYFYWTHRLMHHPRLFRRFHRTHHKSNNPSPFTAYSFDLREAAVTIAFFVGWYAITPTPFAVGALFSIYLIGRNTLLHSGYELMPARPDGRPLLDFFTTTVHHDLHHGEAGYNYGAWFTWWDRWMGTEHPDYYARYARVAWRPFAGQPRLAASGVRNMNAG